MKRTNTSIAASPTPKRRKIDADEDNATLHSILRVGGSHESEAQKSKKAVAFNLMNNSIHTYTKSLPLLTQDAFCSACLCVLGNDTMPPGMAGMLSDDDDEFFAVPEGDEEDMDEDDDDDGFDVEEEILKELGRRAQERNAVELEALTRSAEDAAAEATEADAADANSPPKAVSQDSTSLLTSDPNGQNVAVECSSCAFYYHSRCVNLSFFEALILPIWICGTCRDTLKEVQVNALKDCIDFIADMDEDEKHQEMVEEMYCSLEQWVGKSVAEWFESVAETFKDADNKLLDQLQHLIPNSDTLTIVRQKQPEQHLAEFQEKHPEQFERILKQLQEAEEKRTEANEEQGVSDANSVAAPAEEDDTFGKEIQEVNGNTEQ